MSLLLAMTPSVLLVLYGQLMLKWRIAHLTEIGALGSSSSDRVLAYLQDPLILSGYCSAFMSSVAWMLVIDRYPLNQAFPVYIGLTLCLVMVGSGVLLGETITPMRVVAIALIVAGVTLGAQT